MGTRIIEKSPSERRGSSGSSREDGSVLMRDFNRFIDDMFLNDLPLMGRKFTWIRPNGSALSRLDCFGVGKLVRSLGRSIPMGFK